MTPVIATLTLFGIVTTAVVDLVRNAISDDGRTVPSWVWQAVAMITGETLSFVYHVNALESVSHTPAQGSVGTFLTGLAMAGAATGYHQLWGALSAIKKGAQSPTP